MSKPPIERYFWAYLPHRILVWWAFLSSLHATQVFFGIFSEVLLSSCGSWSLSMVYCNLKRWFTFLCMLSKILMVLLVLLAWFGSSVDCTCLQNLDHRWSAPAVKCLDVFSFEWRKHCIFKISDVQPKSF